MHLVQLKQAAIATTGCCLFSKSMFLLQAEVVIAKRHSTTDSERQQKMVADFDARTKELKQAQSNYNKSVCHTHESTHQTSDLLWTCVDSCLLRASAHSSCVRSLSYLHSTLTFMLAVLAKGSIKNVILCRRM